MDHHFPISLIVWYIILFVAFKYVWQSIRFSIMFGYNTVSIRRVCVCVWCVCVCGVCAYMHACVCVAALSGQWQMATHTHTHTLHTPHTPHTTQTHAHTHTALPRPSIRQHLVSACA